MEFQEEYRHLHVRYYMRKNIEKVLKCFIQGKASGSAGGSCWTNGTVLFSYQTPIVKRDNSGMVWIRNKYPSVTTQGQINSCKTYLDQHYHTVYTVETLDHIHAA